MPVERDTKNQSALDISSRRDLDHKPLTFPQFQSDLEKENQREALNNSSNSLIAYRLC